MTYYIKNHRLAFLFAGSVLFTFIRHFIPFCSGYFGIFFDLILFFTEGIRYIFIISCIIGIIISKSNRKRKAIFFVVEVLFVAIGLISTGHAMTLGALLSIQTAGPDQIRNDARLLFDQYDSETLFSNDKHQRYPFNNPIPKNELPLSLQNKNFGEILVLDDYVFIEKFGATALFRGFIVFRDGADIWKSEKQFTQLDNCNDCWRIRVIDGVYWYHDVPREEEVPTFVLPLK